MSKTSCLTRPPGTTYITIYQSDIDICDGNQCAAALIRYFENWHNHRIKEQAKAKQSNNIARVHGDSPTADETLWQWHTETEMEEGIKIFRRSSIASALKLLVEKNIVTIGRNPNTRYVFDRTRYFLFHPEVVHALYSSNCKSTENNGRTTENNGPSVGSNATIELDSLLNTKIDTLPPIVPQDDSGLGMVAEIRESYGLNPLPERNPSDDKTVASQGRERLGEAEGENLPTPISNPKAKRTPKSKEMSPEAAEVLAYLNRVTGSRYEKIGLIQARLNEGATVEQCKLVIDYLHATWSPAVQDQYLNQISPFRPDNFDKNRVQARKWRPEAPARPVEPLSQPPAPTDTPGGDDSLLDLLNASITERKSYAR